MRWAAKRCRPPRNAPVRCPRLPRNSLSAVQLSQLQQSERSLCRCEKGVGRNFTPGARPNTTCGMRRCSLSILQGVGRNRPWPSRAGLQLQGDGLQVPSGLEAPRPRDRSGLLHGGPRIGCGIRHAATSSSSGRPGRALLQRPYGRCNETPRWRQVLAAQSPRTGRGSQSCNRAPPWHCHRSERHPRHLGTTPQANGVCLVRESPQLLLVHTSPPSRIDLNVEQRPV